MRLSKIITVIFIICLLIGTGITIIPSAVDSTVNRDMYENSPAYQWGTKWESKYARFSSEGYFLGTLETESGSIDVQFFIYKYDIYVLSVEEGLNSYLLPPESGEYLEKWTCEYLKKDKFIAVVEETTYFEEGKEIIFYRTALG